MQSTTVLMKQAIYPSPCLKVVFFPNLFVLKLHCMSSCPRAILVSVSCTLWQVVLPLCPIFSRPLIQNQIHTPMSRAVISSTHRVALNSNKTGVSLYCMTWSCVWIEHFVHIFTDCVCILLCTNLKCMNWPLQPFRQAINNLSWFDHFGHLVTLYFLKQIKHLKI